MLDRLHEGVVIHREDTSIVYANDAASAILGLTNDVLLGKTVADSSWYFTDEFYRRLELSEYPVNRIFKTQTNIIHQLIGIHQGNAIVRWVDINGTLTSLESGERIAMIVFSDVTERKNAYEEVELFKEAIESVDTGVTIADLSQEDEPLIYANRAFSTMTGYSNQEALGYNCRFLQNMDSDQTGRYTIRQAIKEGQSCDVELRNYTKEGKLFYNLLTLSPIQRHGGIRYYVGVQHDITFMKEQEQKLQQKNRYIQSLLDAQEDLVMVSNGKKILYSNVQLTHFFGFDTPQKVLKSGVSTCSRFISNEGCFVPSQQNCAEWIHSILQLPPSKRIVSMKGFNGATHYFDVGVKPFEQEHFIITFHDITDSINKERGLSLKAYHDPLTGAYNRQYFYEFLSKDPTLLGAIMVDLDNFKSINDIYGHDTGDIVLQETLKTIRYSLRSIDYVVRWGGEEIVVLLQVETKNQLLRITENIRHNIENMGIVGIRAITASLGAALKQQNETLENTITRADEALYRAKKNGKNRAFYHELMN